MSAVIECKSRDGITIGLFDAMITIAHTLRERLDGQARRMKQKTDRDPDKWEWFSDEVQEAKADAADALETFLHPYDTKAMEIIRTSARLLEEDQHERKMAALAVAQWMSRTRTEPDVKQALRVLLRNTGWDTGHEAK